MRCAYVTLLLTVAALLGGCLTLQPPAITANSVSLQDVGRRGFSFPIPPGYQASSPEEFQQLVDDNTAAYSQALMHYMTAFNQANRLSSQSVFIYRKDEIVSGKPGTIVLFTYKIVSGQEPFDQHTARRDQRLLKETNRIMYNLKSDTKITASEIITIHGRPWSIVIAVSTNQKWDKINLIVYSLATFGDLNEIYQFNAMTYSGKGSNGINLVDYMAERMEI